MNNRTQIISFRNAIQKKVDNYQNKSNYKKYMLQKEFENLAKNAQKKNKNKTKNKAIQEAADKMRKKYNNIDKLMNEPLKNSESKQIEQQIEEIKVYKNMLNKIENYLSKKINIERLKANASKMESALKLAQGNHRQHPNYYTYVGNPSTFSNLKFMFFPKKGSGLKYPNVLK